MAKDESDSGTGGHGSRKGAGTASSTGVIKLEPRADEMASPRGVEPRAEAVLPSGRLRLGRMAETNGGSSLERVPGFDAARARVVGLLPGTFVPPAPGTRQTRRGEDSLQKGPASNPLPVAVPDTTALPWRCIAMLSITYQNGARATGTAWFVGERALATAGHNISHPDHGDCEEIVVAPGYNGREAPFGTYTVEETHCDPRWLRGHADPFDYGVLLLPDAVVARRLGWFGIADYGDRDLQRMMLNLSGYPNDRFVATQYFTGGRLQRVEASFLDYTFDTSPGMSGAPVFALFDQQRVAVGIHTAAGDRSNVATRINAGVYDFLSRFIHS